jgi:hypothetical protein
MMVTGGNITAIVDQLEKEKLVLRQVGATDRRSFTVKLTKAGRECICRHGGGARGMGGRSCSPAFASNQRNQLHTTCWAH